MFAPPRLKPLTLGVVAALHFAPAAHAVSPDIVISQIYGGGGNTGATLRNDFIELFNRGSAPVSLNGWSVQYASSTGTSWQKTNLTNIALQPGQYYLVQEAIGTGGTVNLPAPDATGTIAMSGTTGKVALVNSQTTIGAVACPTVANGVVDFIGFGAANCSETSPISALTNTTAALRASNGCTDTDNNGADFASGAPAPRNTAAQVNTCSAGGGGTPTVNLSVSASAGSEAGLTVIIVTATASAAVIGAQTVGLTVSGTGIEASDYSLSGATITLPDGATTGSVTFTVADDGIYEGNETATLTLSGPSAGIALGATIAQNILITDNEIAPAACAAPDTAIGQIQGAGAAAALTGTQTVQGVVVGDYEGASPALRGFYLQNPSVDADGDPTTSDAIFVFNADNNSVNLGQVVQVTGSVSEFQGQTQISGTLTIEDCGTTGTVTPVIVNLPVPAPVGGVDYLERYEGMLVSVPQTLHVTEHFQLGRFGQVLLSSGDRLSQPTNIVAPGAPALAQQASNDLSKILLDDNLQSQNPDPIRFSRGGNPLSASNTLRGGDTVTGLTGVMTYTWAGNAASGNAWRVRPINALGATLPNFQAVNLRPTVPAQVNGRLKVASANLLNFFNTFDGLPDTVDNCVFGVGGGAADCRGADTQAEFDRQWPKTVQNLVGTGADVLLVNEIENDGYGANSAIQFLVDKLNAATASGTYAFINADLASNQTNALGTDAIKVGMIYKPATVTPVEVTAPLNTGAFGIFDTGAGLIGRSRPALAQAFEENATGARFIAVANHLKSKGSACDDNIGPVGPDVDAGDGQGNCNLTRKAAAEQLVDWLVTDPTGTNDPDILIAGDLNSYAKEDPITAIKNGGYINLIESRIGAKGYSYVFDGQWGYLDHALASPSLNTQVADVLEWHINSDEPSVLDYNTDFKTANLQSVLYAPDAFRTSDHDPIVVGLDLTVPVNVISGNSGNNTLAGTPGNDRLIGLAGRDTLTGNGGNDEFVYTSVLDGSDIIVDFTVGADRIVLTGLLQSLGVSSSNPIADAYLLCNASSTPADSTLSIDRDASGPALKRSLILVKNVPCGALMNPTNFMY